MSIDRERLRTGGALLGPLARSALPVLALRRTLEPGDMVGAFRIVRELSRGGMAVVYLAERADGEFEQHVALKWMAVAGDRTAAEALFRRERQTLARLEHPGIARLVDGGRTVDSMLWFAMELVDGEPIDAWCTSHKVSRNERLRLVISLCEALAFAHAQLLVHRDIKPSNVLVDAAGRIKLLDFGIARLADQDDLLGNFALTPRYASPEQWRGEPVTVSSDVYQGGLLLATLLGVLPAMPTGAHATALQGDRGAAPALLDARQLAHLPRDLAAIVQRATALDTAQRYPSVTALADDLSRLLEHRPVAARKGGVLYRAGCIARRHPFSISGALLALVLLGASGWRIAIERDVARQQATRATTQAQRAQSALDFLQGLLAWATPQKHRGEEKTVAAALEYGVDQLHERADDPPAVRAQLLYLFGQVYSQRRERERSRSLYEQAYALLHEDPHADTGLLAETAYGLASQSSDASDRARSLALIDEAMQLYDGIPEKAERRIHAWRLKAIRLNQDGRLDQAITENRAALASATERLGHDNVATARVMHDLSGRLAEAGQDDEALALKREGYEILKRRLGVDHPDTSLASMGLAGLLVGRGDYFEAERLMATDGAIRLRLWGDQHTEYARHLYLVGSYRLQIGDARAARAIAEQAIAINEASGAIGRTALASQYELLGRANEALGDLDAALAAFRRGLQPDLFGAKLGYDGGDLYLGAARVLRKLDRFGESQLALREAAGIWRSMPERHPTRAGLAIESGFASLERGDAFAARAEAERARDLLPARPEWDASRDELVSLQRRLVIAGAPMS